MGNRTQNLNVDKVMFRKKMGKDMCEYISKLDLLNWTNIIDNKYDE